RGAPTAAPPSPGRAAQRSAVCVPEAAAGCDPPALGEPVVGELLVFAQDELGVAAYVPPAGRGEGVVAGGAHRERDAGAERLAEDQAGAAAVGAGGDHDEPPEAAGTRPAGDGARLALRADPAPVQDDDGSGRDAQ